ncbi:MAG: hypothetical protein J5706_09195 [Elusimicrobiales bacterium]|nr:hypothetical protein [Elusimicrobiales bacterium]
MRALLLIPAFFVFSACIKAYIPFVGEPKYEEIIKQGKALYPDLFISPRETEKIGNPSISISLGETSDIGKDPYSFSSKEMASFLSAYGFSLKQNSNSDIIIKGSVHAAAGAVSGLGSFLDYKAQCNFVAADARTGRQIASFKNTVAGLGLNPKDAAEAALANAGRDAAKNLARDIISYYRMQSVVRLEVYNLPVLQDLNAFYLKLKGIKGVHNVWLIDYRGGNAYFDVSCAYGGAGNLARGLIETYGTDLKINRPSLMKLEAVIQKKDK